MRIAISVLLLSSAAAFAQPADTRDEEAGAAVSGGVCIGTVADCAEREAVTRQGFDLRVDFAHDSAELTPAARDRLADFAAALRDNRLKQRNFLLEGHTDAYGRDDYNMRLSERRARAVADFLVGSGVARERVTPVGKGETAPRTDNPYDPANRRVEMRVE